MKFNPEDRITWEELAPSLQELFKNLQSQITKEVERAIAEEKKLQEAIDNLSFGMLHGGKGQVLKIDIPGFSLKPDDNFHIMRVVSDDSGLGLSTTTKVPPISLKEVFNTWDRHYNDHGNQDYGYTQDGMGSGGPNQTWSYNDTIKAISNNGNWHVYAYFLSKQKYDTWEMTVRLHQMSINDDDMLGIIVGANTDANGKVHTILAAIHGNAQSPNAGQVTTNQGHMPLAAKHKLVLVYDYNGYQNHDPDKEIVLAYDNAAIGGLYGDGDVLFKVKKEGAKISLWRTNFGGTTFISSLEWEVPMTKPAGWDQTAYGNIKDILANPAPMGFATMSNDCRFILVSQSNIFLNETIYDLKNGKKFIYVNESPNLPPYDPVYYPNNDIPDPTNPNGCWRPFDFDDPNSEEIPWRCWIWNRVTGELYWYQQPGTYYKVHSDLELRKHLYGFPVGNGELEESLAKQGTDLDTVLISSGQIGTYNTKILSDRITALGG